MIMDALDRIATLNPITFLKSMVTVNRSASGGISQKYVEYTSTTYPNGQVVRGVDTVSEKTIVPPNKVGTNIDVRV